MIKLINVSKNFPNKEVINNLSIEFSKGSFSCIIGPSGCGKSTLLKLIAELESPDKGQIIKPENLKISYVFQDAALIPWLTVKENILLALSENKFFSAEQKNKKLNEIIQLVKLAKNENIFPHQLSGGMKMRVSIARALINDPDVLLLDEPFSALDEQVRFELQEELWNLWTEKKMNVFFVTHAISEAVFLGEQILIFNKNQVLTLPNAITLNRQESLRSEKSYLDQTKWVTLKSRELSS